jgi:hypothetical protein
MDNKEAREVILKEVDQHFVGPRSPDETIEDNPWDFYHTAMLWPYGEQLDPYEDDQELASGMADDSSSEGILNMANCGQQSAMGISTQLEKRTQKIWVNVSWGEYFEFCGGHSDRPVKVNWKKEKQEHGPNFWQRVGCEESVEILINADDLNKNESIYSNDGLEVRQVLRATNEALILTVVLINKRSYVKGDRYRKLVYQPEIGISTQEGSHFKGRVSTGNKVNDPEFWNYELLYHNARQFAVGHGCSAQWDETSEFVSKVRTTWIPRQKVGKASAGLPFRIENGERQSLFDDTEFLNLDMLTDADNKLGVISKLRQFVAVYRDWILAREGEIEEISALFGSDEDEIRKAAVSNIELCHSQCERVKSGIDYLEKSENEIAWRSFCLANETIRASMLKARPDKKPQWRIFQLAFILLSLPSTLERNHVDRDVLDLIWFPTGGGKTEAYLGLAAALLFYRRSSLSSPTSADGTAVITRYTLRLLTIQQFERAASMICAANLVSASYSCFEGFTPFTIGLFVGGGATPNKLKGAQKILDGESDNLHCTTLPIQKCPWCRSDLLQEQQYIDASKVALVTPCSNTDCDFHRGLPIVVVDEQIYHHPPSVVIGTVDKFAMMAWVPQMRSLFGSDSRRPDLIIQDELHLISDALGTVTALYEGAVDHLTSIDGKPAKIVGSTATIRRAEEHVRKLFNRRLAQFPPSGISASDSFFYQIDHSQDRLYVGLHAQGRSPKHSLARLAGNISQANNYLDTECRDPFYTLVMYFNSLRELGGALVLLEDDVPRYLDSLPLAPGSKKRILYHKQELTSQLNQQELGGILDHLSVGLGQDENIDPVDAVLSTNMISVGVDVGRLNVMIVNGQPKNTAEYIQASSRVGREEGSAGVVFTMYNWTRPRDRSHYERFKAFHLAFYRHVESTSVTPFASRARDRALPAVLFSMARQSIDSLREDSSAAEIMDKSVLEKVEMLAEYIVERAALVDENESENTREHLDQLIAYWREFAGGVLEDEKCVFWRLPLDKRKRAIKKREDLDRYEMLKGPDEYGDDGRIKVPMSMRDVEPPTNVQLIVKK